VKAWVRSTSGDTDLYMGARVFTLSQQCGDGYVEGTESCDDGTNNGVYNYCNSTCTGPGPRCGDSIKNGPEACDDGDADDTDGCKNNCTLGTCQHSIYVDGDFDTEFSVTLVIKDQTTGATLLDDYGWYIDENFTVTHSHSIRLEFGCWSSDDYDYELYNKYGTIIKDDEESGCPDDYTFTASCD
ncbi:MAG TPA: hypothetical protein PLZ43_04015, partial [bacterium]|nr:hypothetical protein [bacterium]